ncbi:hypothetical protein PanWU01x14_013000 [Parasponia andersonii]|uniref:THUMP domain-containing protein n=1 Tax=Parasponia andersonii TaxID=3476 RepID=A0A2P5E0V9_PARAD|nr:hypothetical protein PanWU01x14_013000 [Parasponia andersonii]
MAEVREETATATQKTQAEHIQNKTETDNEVSKGQEEEKVLKSSSSMKPWEQHGGVISIPRFDYNAPSSLLQYSHSGFLITCTIKREKSATKEAMSILGRYVGSFTTCSNETLDNSDENLVSKRRKTCMEDLDSECIHDYESKAAADDSEDKSVESDVLFIITGNHLKVNSLSSSNTNTTEERNHVLSLVKLTRSGLLLFTFARGTSFDPVHIVSNIIRSLESAGSSSPQWCHRIFPIQATCCLDEKELRVVVSKLVIEFMNDGQSKLAMPLKFAIGYNRRGIAETEMKHPKDTSHVSAGSNLLDRNSCFSIVAAAVKDALPDSVVDLQSPELSVLVELLPLSRIPNGSLVVAVSVLPQNLVSTKPRLCVKALASNVKAKGAKH